MCLLCGLDDNVLVALLQFCRTCFVLWTLCKSVDTVSGTATNSSNAGHLCLLHQYFAEGYDVPCKHVVTRAKAEE